MAFELRAQDAERIQQHAAAAYPSECCGFLLGREENGRRTVLEIAPLQNAWGDFENNPYEVRPQDSTRNRSLVDPKDYLRVDKEARQKGMDIIGFYHSHPDHPARPSEFDLKHALDYLLYVILSVEQGVPREMTGWLLSADRTRFLSEAMSIQ